MAANKTPRKLETYARCFFFFFFFGPGRTENYDAMGEKASRRLPPGGEICGKSDFGGKKWSIKSGDIKGHSSAARPPPNPSSLFLFGSPETGAP
jgi:hypothetical protein